MNQKLQNIQDIIQQSEKLDAEQKDKLLKAIKDADKELEITSFKLDRTEKVKKTTAILLEETIEELEQKRKAVEEQNRELEIQSALERVRSVALSMIEPADMIKLCTIIADELNRLGVKEIRNVQTIILNEKKSTYLVYQYFKAYRKGIIEDSEYSKHPTALELAKTIKKSANAFFSQSFIGTSLHHFRKYRKLDNQFLDPKLDRSSSVHFYFYSIGPGALGLSTYNNSLNDNELNLLKQFRNVFELAYKRFTDIERAMTQAREAQIEAALERIRSRALGMRKSEEVGNVTDKLFEELNKLTLKVIGCTIVVIDEKKDTWETWRARTKVVVKPFEVASFKKSMQVLKKHLPKWFQEFNEALGRREKFLIEEMPKRRRTQFLNSIAEQYNYNEKEKSKLLKITPDKITAHFLFFKLGYLALIAEKRLPDENLAVAGRFVEVFDFAYTRFLDIKKAEEQAREAQIEASLERVRAQAMGMTKPDDLLNICKAQFTELKQLGFSDLRNSLISIFNDDKGFFLDYDYSDFAGGSINNIDYDSHPAITNSVNKIRKGNDVLSEFSISGKELDEWNEYRRNIGERKDPRLENISALYYYMYSIGSGAIGISNFKPVSEEQLQILKRFRNVFDLAYRRYNDIALAEAQAREAQIEATLERVRSRTMGMQKSEELKDVIQLVYEQFVHLKINVDHAGFVVDYTPKGDWHFWIADQQEIPSKITHPYFDSVWAHQFNEAKEKGIDFFATNLNFEEKNKFYNELLSYVPGLPEKSKDFYLSCPGLAATTALFDNVSIYIENFSGTPYSNEENKILMRFGKVFQQTYTRFLDLQRAEEQAREAQIEASLEKVRAVAMSMNKSEDLLSICEVSFKEFKKLGFENIRNALIHIQYDEQKYFMDYDFSDLTGGAITKIEYGSHPIVEDYLKQIRSAKDAFYQGVIKGDQLEEWKDFRRKSGQIDDPRLEKATSLYYYFFSIGIGDIGISTLQPIDESQIKILKRFRNVFDLAYRRYDDIKLAEEQARETQIQLALERVRARTMAMHKSEELSETSFVLFEQLKELGEVAEQISIGIFNEKDNLLELYATIFGNQWKESGRFPLTKHPVHKKTYEAWKNQETSLIIDLSGEELTDFNRFKMETSTQYKSEDELPKNRWIIHSAFFSKGVLIFSTYEPRSIETLNILERFAGVFDLTYTRFLDLKKAEAQAREAEIEAALERARSRTMAMQKSDELAETASHFFEQLNSLGIKSYRFNIAIVNQESEECQLWSTSNEGKVIPLGPLIPLKEHKVFNQMYYGWKRQGGVSEIKVQGEDRIEWTKYIMKYVSFNEYKPENIDLEKLRNEPAIFSNFFFKQGFIVVHTIEAIDEADTKIIQRFVNVFEQTYTRFLDLKNAEAQAKEAQIEAALEKVRSRTMAMHNSSELAEVATVLFEQISLLDNTPDRFNIRIVNEVEGAFEFWATDQEGRLVNKFFKAEFDKSPVVLEMYNSWKAKEKILVQDLYGDQLSEWVHFIKDILGVPFNIGHLKEHRFLSSIFFSHGMIGITTNDPPNSETLQLIERFTKVFQQTYTRFLDLQKAEEQARESQIEAALERVRAKAMAMHSSNDLSDTMGVLFNELPKLGIASLRCGVVLLSRDTTEGIFYAAATTLESDSFTMIGSGDMKKHPVFTRQYESWLKNENCFFTLSDEELQSYYKEIFARLSITYNPKEHKLKTEHGYYFAFSEGMFYAWSKEPYTEESINILNRFKAIIDLTFRRYLDLQKAEARAREAKIETSLERVRSKAMAMHNPNDLSETVNVFFKELKTLGIVPIRCGVGQMDEATRTTRLTTTTSSQQGDSFQVIGKVKQTGHPVMDGIFDHWKMQKEYHPILEGEEIKAYYSIMNPQIGYPEYPEGVTQFGNIFPFKEGFVFAWTENKLSEEELQIFRRFTSVLSLTYRRYIDLKAAEVRAFEAVRQASLDRIRAEIASMRTSEDLNRITPIIWRELKTLEVPFFRCGVYIVDEKTEMVQVYLTTPDGKSLGVLNLSFDSNDITNNTVEHWRKKIVYKTHWDKEEFIEWTKSMMRLGQIQSAETYQGSTTPPDSLYLHFVPFAQGMLYVGDVNPLTDEKLQLVKTLAEAFSIAYARYEDFRNLEEAKSKIEVTLNELRAAQAQLIHSEKMASLGELTAGIAHEIKNPLNFVNNFSEVSRELLDEMKTEIENKNIDEVIELIEDLKQNLDKINQHGKRADSIVKGMLLHSRGTSGEKTLTDINDLLDQYVNLAYHGMRATNKEFNIAIEKDYDESIEKINVVPQDISRVFLNIINNACYAAFDKKKKSENNFSPLLKVSTKKVNNRIEIKIGDNGNGIPSEHLDKIFQPFFTTKPSGEGTGLGLSLSYDIVTKVHGGEMKVETKLGLGTEFFILLPSH